MCRTISTSWGFLCNHILGSMEIKIYWLIDWLIENGLLAVCSTANGLLAEWSTEYGLLVVCSTENGLLAVCSTEKNVTNCVAICVEDTFVKKFSSRLREKKKRVYFSGGLHDNHGKRNQLHVKTQSYRAVNTLQLDCPKNQSMLYSL
jgi:hypothetical protein